jgi:2'-5' RNA ligase
VRAFIAIDLDPEIKSALEALVRALKSSRADVRWVGAGAMHLTLKFLGQIDEARADRVRRVLDTIACRHAPFGIRVEGTGSFPDEKRPRVLWAGFAAEPKLGLLQEDLDRALEPEGFARENRAFTPHLTLGRVKGPDRLAAAMAELDRHKAAVFGAMLAGRLALFESLLRPEGAEYRIVHEAVLT